MLQNFSRRDLVVGTMTVYSGSVYSKMHENETILWLAEPSIQYSFPVKIYIFLIMRKLISTSHPIECS